MDRIRQRNSNNVNIPEEPNPSVNNVGVQGDLVSNSQKKAPIINHPEALPISLSEPHNANFGQLTPEISGEATKRFQKEDAPLHKEQGQTVEEEGFWSKAKACMQGCIHYCMGWTKGKLASGEVQQTSKILSAGRKFQAGTTHALSTQNLFNLTRAPKEHLDYGLSALSAAAGLYKFLSKHGKEREKHVKMLKHIDEVSNAFEKACKDLGSIKEALQSRIEYVRQSVLKDPHVSEVLVDQEAKLSTLANEIEALKAELQATTGDEIEQIEELAILEGEYKTALQNYNAFIFEVDKISDEGPYLDDLEAKQALLQEELNVLDQDITELLHESHELSKRERVTTALLLTSATKTAITATKTTVHYGSDYCAILSEHGKTINSYLKNYAMLPVFVTGFGVSAYSTYTLGYDYSHRTEIEKTAQAMLTEETLDPELEAFVSLVASRQRTTQTLLSFGSAAGKVAQNALALGVAFGGISVASAATGISEEVLTTVITPVSWALGGAIACTSLGLKAYQNYQEANRKSQEDYWIQILNENSSEIAIEEQSDAYLELAECVLNEIDKQYDLLASDEGLTPMERIQKHRNIIDTVIRNQATLNLMKLNVDFATGVIIARLNSIDESVSKQTEAMLWAFGLQGSDIESLKTLSPKLASNSLKEKLCLL